MKIKYFIPILVTISILLITDVRAEEYNIDVNVRYSPGLFIFEGNSIVLTFEITNNGENSIDNLVLKYHLKESKSNSYYFSESINIETIEAGKTIVKQIEKPLQMSTGGLYNILLIAKQNGFDIDINGEKGENLIRSGNVTNFAETSPLCREAYNINGGEVGYEQQTHN